MSSLLRNTFDILSSRFIVVTRSQLTQKDALHDVELL